jgi:hypothetical protein
MKRFSYFIIVVIATLAVTAASAAASHSYRTSGGTPLHWASVNTNTAQVLILSTLYGGYTGRWAQYLQETEADWDSPTANWNSSISPSSADPSACPYSDGRIRVCSAAFGSTGWAGLAQWQYDNSTGHILRGRNWLNDDTSGIKSSGSCGGMPCQDYAKAVVCQELGHTLGFDHVNAYSCMGTSYFPSALGATRPNTNDTNELNANHAHVDSITEDGGDGECPISSECGGTTNSKPATNNRRNGRSFEPPPKGNCGTKRVDEHTKVRRVCERGGPNTTIVEVTVEQ